MAFASMASTGFTARCSGPPFASDVLNAAAYSSASALLFASRFGQWVAIRGNVEQFPDARCCCGSFDDVPEHRHYLPPTLNISCIHIHVSQRETMLRNHCFAKRFRSQVCDVFFASAGVIPYSQQLPSRRLSHALRSHAGTSVLIAELCVLHATAAPCR